MKSVNTKVAVSFGLGVALSLAASGLVPTDSLPSGVKPQFDALQGIPTETLDAQDLAKVQDERIRIWVKLGGVKIGAILMGSCYRGPKFDGSVDITSVIVIPWRRRTGSRGIQGGRPAGVAPPGRSTSRKHRIAG